MRVGPGNRACACAGSCGTFWRRPAAGLPAGLALLLRLSILFHFREFSRDRARLLILKNSYGARSFASAGAHALLCLLNFLGSSRTLGVVSRLA